MLWSDSPLLTRKLRRFPMSKPWRCAQPGGLVAKLVPLFDDDESEANARANGVSYDNLGGGMKTYSDKLKARVRGNIGTYIRRHVLNHACAMYICGWQLS